MREKKQLAVVVLSLTHRITPAYAGKKPERKAPRRPRLGSPRVCGEKKRTVADNVAPQGSPPAYAGKRTLFCLAGRRNRDHPRVCGEKCSDHIDKGMIEGSPPRMRKKYCASALCFACWGSPPRMREKRAEQAHSMSCSEDHPRVCGEKSGSCFFSFHCARITPAYAGKKPS